jgi:hypothetical protein
MSRDLIFEFRLSLWSRMRSDDRKDNALDHAVVLCQGKDNEEILRLLRKAGFTK